ncbi:hypothetical protein [Pelagibacterium halotolerans]|uniref:hypothetical protein n=1 Tax=Pelagibacterium halotolerans TaxID=531813 RepID=UPI00384B3777
MASKLTVTHLSHDLGARKSYVSFVWADDPSKRLGLEVPFGTELKDAEREAIKAVRQLSGELATINISMP